MINIFVLVTILGHLPVILFAKRKGNEDMKQILIVEDDSFLNKMLDYNLTADGYGVTSPWSSKATSLICGMTFTQAAEAAMTPEATIPFRARPFPTRPLRR